MPTKPPARSAGREFRRKPDWCSGRCQLAFGDAVWPCRHLHSPFKSIACSDRGNYSPRIRPSSASVNLETRYPTGSANGKKTTAQNTASTPYGIPSTGIIEGSSSAEPTVTNRHQNFASAKFLAWHSSGEVRQNSRSMRIVRPAHATRSSSTTSVRILKKDRRWRRP